MEAIVLTVKRNSCKNALPEAASSHILRKFFHQIQLQSITEMLNKGAFTPMKLCKQL